MDTDKIEKEFKEYCKFYYTSAFINLQWNDILYVLKTLNITLEQMYENESSFDKYIQAFKEEYSEKNNTSKITKHSILSHCYNLQHFLDIKKNPVIMTGYTELDKLTGGFKRGELILIAGRPAMGKTAFALNLANAFMSERKITCLFSLEMSKHYLLKYIKYLKAGIDIQKINSGNLQPDDFGKLRNAMIKLAGTRIYIDDAKDVTPNYIKDKCKTKILDVIIIDYLQLMKNDKSTPKNRQILCDLKKLAVELNIPVIVLSRISKRIERRKDKHPLLTDLWNSTSIKDILDKILFLYREDYYDFSEPEKRGIAEIIVAKNNNGETGTVNLLYDSEKRTFRNIERKNDEH